VLVADCASKREEPAESDGHQSADARRGAYDGSLAAAAEAMMFGLGELLDARERGVRVEPFQGLVEASALVVRRARRLAAALGPTAPEPLCGTALDWDTSASVVVLDRSVASLRRIVETLRPSAPAVALADGLDSVAAEVARWNARVSDAFRIALGARIREGTAPSPFCTTEH